MPIPNSFKPTNPFGPPLAQKQETEQPKAPVVQKPTVQAPVTNNQVQQSNGAVMGPPLASTAPAVQAPRVEAPKTAAPAVDTTGLDSIGDAFAGLNSNPAPEEIAPKTAKVKNKAVKPVNDIYNSVSRGETNPLGLQSMYVKAREMELREYSKTVVQPAYDAYKKAKEGFEAGKVSEADYNKALREYKYIYNQSIPLWDALDDIRDRDNLKDMRGVSAADIETALKRWDTAYADAVLSLEDADRRLAEMQTKYDADSASLSADWDQFEKDVAAFQAKGKKATQEEYDALIARQEALNKRANELNAFEDEFASAVGKYRANAWLTGDMEYVLRTGQDMWQDQYIRENPAVLWAKDVGAQYDENNQMVAVTATFNDVYDRMEELQEQLKSLPEGADRDALLDEYTFYNGLLNSGLVFKNLTQGEFDTAEKFFQDRISELEEQLAAYSWVTDFDAAVAAGQSVAVPEGRDISADREAYNDLMGRINEARAWIQKLESREYEATYDNVISGLSKDTQKMIDDYQVMVRNAAAGNDEVFGSTTPMIGGDGTDIMLDQARVFNMKYSGTREGELDQETGEYVTVKATLRKALEAEGLTNKEIQGIMDYLQYAANAAWTEEMSQDVAATSAEASHLGNYLTQLVLSMGSSQGAIGNTMEGLGRLMGGPDPYLGKAAPIDYNSFNNLSTLATQAVGQGEYEKIWRSFFDEDDPEADRKIAERKANLAYDAYNLLQSMGQSTIMALTGRALAAEYMTAAAGKASLFLLSGSAASQTMQDLHRQGYSDAGVVVGGLISGYVEYLTEEYSLEKLLKTVDLGKLAGMTKGQVALALGWNSAMQTIAEASEEGASTLLNMLYDECLGRFLNGGLTQIELAAVQAQRDNPGMSWEDALRGAWKDWGVQLRDDMVAGALSGLAMGAGGYGIGYATGTISAAQSGRDVIQQGKYNRFTEEVARTVNTVAAQATKLTNPQSGQSKLSTGRLLNRYADTAYVRMIETRLDQLGETDVTPELLRAINNGAAGHHLTSAERTALNNSRFGMQALNELKAYNEAVAEAQESGKGLDMEGLEDWTQAADLARATVLDQFTNENLRVNESGQFERISAKEAQYRRTVANNPGAVVFTQTQTELEEAGATVQDAAVQGALLDKLFKGQPLTGKEMRRLDLNNPAVRSVFVRRSGLTGIPSGRISNTLKATYANRVAQQSRAVVENATDIRQGVATLVNAAQEESAQRTKDLQAAAQNGPENPYAKIAREQSDGTRKGNKAAQARATSANYAARSAQVSVEGMPAAEALPILSNKYGQDIMSREQFLEAFRQGMLNGADTMTAAQQATADGAYIEYLQKLGLTSGEIRVLTGANVATTGRSTAAAQQRRAQTVTAEHSEQVGLDTTNDTVKKLIKERKITRRTIRALDYLGRVLGIRIQFAESIVNGEGAEANAMYHDGVLTISVSTDDPIRVAAIHEAIHRLRVANAEAYALIHDRIFEALGNNTAALDTLRQRMSDLYGMDKMSGDLEEEITCQAMGVVLGQSEYLDRLAADGRDAAADAFDDLLDWVADANDRLGGAVTSADQVAYHDLRNVIGELANLFRNGLVRADTDIDGDPAPAQFSLKGTAEATGFRLEETEDGLPYAVIDKNGNRVTDITPDMLRGSPLDRVIGMSVANDFITTEDAGKQLEFMAKIMTMIAKTDAPDLVWSVAGTELFSAVKANSDTQYSLTIDFTAICKQTEAMVNAMSESMKRSGKGLTREEVERLYRTVHKLGEEVPCPVCYVFSRWIGIGGLLDQINNFQNAYANRTESELRQIIRDVEAAAEQYARENPKEKFFPKKNSKAEEDTIDPEAEDNSGPAIDGILLGKVISDRKSQVNNRIKSLTGRLQKVSDAALYIQIYDYLLGDSEELSQEATTFGFTKAMEEDTTAGKTTSAKTKAKAEQNAAILKAAIYGKQLDTKALKGLKSKRSAQQKVINTTNTEEIQAEIEQAQQELAQYEAYQWLTKTVMIYDEATEQWVRNPTYSPVPPEILFDLNAGAEFAGRYSDTWKYRTTRGAAMGKAITPYADARVGETIQGAAAGGVKNIRVGSKLNEFLNGDQKKAEKTLKSAIARMAKQNLIGGMRYQSVSDFRYDYGSDYLLTFFEMQAMGAKVQLYTKVIEAVDFLASVGAECNLSVMPLDKGFIELEDGTKKLIYSPVTGINAEAAIDRAHHYDNVQLILVGISDEHIRLALSGTDVTFVIPFHGSGNTVENIQTLMKAVGESIDLRDAQDYTEVQSDHAIPEREKKFPELQAAWDLRMNIIQGKLTKIVKGQLNNIELTADQQAILDSNEILADLYRRFYLDKSAEEYGNFLGTAQANQIFPYEYWDKTLDYDHADENGERFKRYCASLGVIPRFSGRNSKGEQVTNKITGKNYGDFSNDKGYWKLLIDRPMYNNKYDAQGNWIGYGGYHEQRRINVTNANIEALNPKYGETHYGEVMKKVADPKKTNAIVDAFLADLNREGGVDNSAVTGDNEGKFSLKQVPPVRPSNDSWERGHTESWFREHGFPIFADVPEEQRQVNEEAAKKAEEALSQSKGKHKTANPSTISTYKKVFTALQNDHPSDWQDLRVLDASSGLGLGTALGRDMGLNVEDIEPFHGDRTPDYEDYSKLEDMIDSGEVEPFDFIVSNAVLNVLAQDTRDEMVAFLGKALKPGGQMFINVIAKTYAGAANSTPEVQTKTLKNGKTVNVGVTRTQEGDYSATGDKLGKGHETFVWQSNSVQKVFSTRELIGYLSDALGPGYSFKPSSLGGVSVYVTKSEDGARFSLKQPLTEAQQKNYDFNQNQTQVGGILKHLTGTSQRRFGGTKAKAYSDGVGKEVSGTLYFHKDYANKVIKDPGALLKAQLALQQYAPNFEYNCMTYTPKTGAIRFDEAPDFDTAREPIPGRQITVDADGKVVRDKTNNQIWHHKWQWVQNDYTGFDVEESWNWSKQYLNTLRQVDSSEHRFSNNRGKGSFAQNGIPDAAVWDEQLDYWELPHDPGAPYLGVRDPKFSVKQNDKAVADAKAALDLMEEVLGKDSVKNLQRTLRTLEREAEKAKAALEEQRTREEVRRKDLRQRLRVAAKQRSTDAAAQRVRASEQQARINAAFKAGGSKVRIGSTSDISGAIEYALNTVQAEKLRIAQQLAEEQAQAKKNAAIDKQWGRGMKQSERREGKKETKRRVREAVTNDRKLHTLPATAAATNRRSYRADLAQPINDNQAIATPIIPGKDRSFRTRVNNLAKAMKQFLSTAYRRMTSSAAEIERMSKLQTRRDSLAVWTNVVRAASSSVERFYDVGMLSRTGETIGPAMKDLLLCLDEKGHIDMAMQNALNDYMFHLHNMDRMSIRRRAMERVQAYEARYSWLADITDNEFKTLVSDGNPFALEYARRLKALAEAEDLPVLPDADGNPVTAETSQRVVAEYEQSMPWLVQKANAIYEYWDVFNREWAVGSLVSEEKYQEFREKYPHYVPTYRTEKGGFVSAMSVGRQGASTGEYSKAAKGSLLPLVRMEDQFVKRMQYIVKNNRLNSLLVNMNEEFMNDDGRFEKYGYFDEEGSDLRDAEDLLDNELTDDESADLFVKREKENGQNVFHVFCRVNGRVRAMYVNQAMYEGLLALAGKRSDTVRKITNVGRAITSPMKTMITGVNLNFALKNPIRDLQTGLVNSCVGLALPKYMVKAAGKIARADYDWITFQNLGGVSAEYHKQEGGYASQFVPAKGVVQQTASRVKQAKNWVMEKLSKPGEVTEAVTRFAEYLAALDQLGGDTYENRLAAIRAAAEVTVDFGRKGDWGGMINAWVPYWNPGIQGIDKALRNVASDPSFWAIAKKVGRIGLVNIVPRAFMLALIMAAGRKKDFDKLSDQVKDNYFVIPLPNTHKFLKVPISQDWGAFLGTPILRIMEGVTGRDDVWENFFESALASNLPFDLQEVAGTKIPVITPIGLDWYMELQKNKDHNGKAIIPYNLKDASAKEQWDADTSELAYLFARALSKVVPGDISPMALDYVINDYCGNFYGILLQLVPHGYFTGDSDPVDKLNEALQSLLSPWVADNRYSSSVTASYYNLISQLEQDVTDTGVHGDPKDSEYYYINEALHDSNGYATMISELSKQARDLPPGSEKDAIREQIAGLADEALEFFEAWKNGKIKDPELWMTYHRYGDAVLKAVTDLGSDMRDEFNVNGNLGNPQIVYDRSGDTAVKYNLKDQPDLQRAYQAVRAEHYQNEMSKVIGSSRFKSTKDKAARAAMLEDARAKALKDAEKEFIRQLKEVKFPGENVGSKDYSEQERAAAYYTSWLLGEDNAYKPEITDQFVDLYDYHDQYSFIPTDAAKKTFADPSERKPGEARMVYVLDKDQQAKYAQVYHDEITDAYTKVMATPEYKAASPELRAAMLAKAKTYANESVTEKFYSWLQQTGATATTKDVASPDISLEAKYAVQRAMGDDHAMKREVTDELVRLYQYSDVGEVEFFPIATAPKQYVDDRNKKYMWELDDTQREVYMSMMFDIYQKNILKVMGSHQYQIADDRGKAQLLCDVRSRLSGEVQAEFKHWLRTSGAPRTYRKSDEIKAQEAEIAAAQKIVDQLLGKARSYKDFNKQRHY